MKKTCHLFFPPPQKLAINWTNSKQTNKQLFFLSRLHLLRSQSVDLRSNQTILPHIIKIPTLPPRYFADLDSTTLRPKNKGTPTLRIMLTTKPNFKTREYLPIQPIDIHEYLSGLTWIHTKSLTPPGITLLILSITDPEFQETHLPFRWDTSIHPEQFILPHQLNLHREIRKRIWKPSTGKSILCMKPIEDVEEVFPPSSQETNSIKQRFTWTLSLETMQTNRALLILLNGMGKDLIKPIFGNVYLRIFDNMHSYYVLHYRPSKDGITIIIHPHEFYFSRISGYPVRFMYKALSKLSGVNDWNIISDHFPEYRLLAHPLPYELHARLSGVLSPTY